MASHSQDIILINGVELKTDIGWIGKTGRSRKGQASIVIGTVKVPASPQPVPQLLRIMKAPGEGAPGDDLVIVPADDHNGVV